MSTQPKVTSTELIEKIIVSAIDDENLRARLLEDPTEDLKRFMKEEGYPAEGSNVNNVKFVEQDEASAHRDDENVIIGLPSEAPSMEESELSETELEMVAGGEAQSILPETLSQGCEYSSFSFCPW